MYTIYTKQFACFN